MFDKANFNLRLYAFWEYDSYPYVLGAEVTHLLENGRVKVVGYDGFSFKPIAILPYLQGVYFKSELKALEEDYEDTVNEYRDCARTLIEQIKNWNK
jgi:hypothetical protein